MVQTLDLEQIVRDWAWREYDRTATRSQKKLREKEKRKHTLDIHVDWSGVRFSDVTVWPHLNNEAFGGDEANHGDATGDGCKTVGLYPALHSGKKSIGATPDVGKTKTSILFRTKFTNATTDTQQYTMRTQKTTRSSCTTEVETGWTKGVEFSVKLATPGEVFEANAGYHREMTLTQLEGQTIDEEVTWGVDSEISVKPGHMAEAQLVVNEKKHSGDFVVTSKIQGIVCVSFTNVRDNNSQLKLVNNWLDDILQKHLDMKKRIGESYEFVNIDGHVITICTKGKCNFRYGIKQEVLVHQEAIN